MAAFATPTELAGFLQSDLDTYSATQALDIASQAIRDHCGWTISQETVTAQVLDSHGERSIWLPSLLLTDVGPVLERGVTLTVTSDYDWTAYGRLIRSGCWPNEARSVTVTYTHGYVNVPDSVKGACLSAAGRVYSNPDGIRQESVGGVSVTYNTPLYTTGVYLTDQERSDLGKYNLEHVG